MVFGSLKPTFQMRVLRGLLGVRHVIRKGKSFVETYEAPSEIEP